MIKGRENNNNNNKGLIKVKPPSSDLLVCFPTRAHLTLMPKPICSPSRPNSESIKRHLNHNHHLRRINTRAASSLGAGSGPGNNNNNGSPLIWAKDNQIRGGGPEMSEPTSPKVTCAGQIKVRPRSSSNTSNHSCRNWQSVMEEIEKIHHTSSNSKKKSSSLVQPFGFKKDVMNFLTCLRNVRFDFRCFGSFPDQELSSEDEEEEEEEDDDVFEEEDTFKEIIDEVEKYNDGNVNNDIDNNAVFSKWFMVLQENQSNDDSGKKVVEHEMGNDDTAPAVPPPNALLLMRCRSAPAKSWLEEKEEEERENKEENEGKKAVDEEEKEEKMMKKKRETLAIVMKYDTDFYKLSNDIAQETWVVGEIKGPLSRSRSWRR